MWGRLLKPVLMCTAVATVTKSVIAITKSVIAITKSMIAATKNRSATHAVSKDTWPKSAVQHNSRRPHSHLAEDVAATEAEGTPSGWTLPRGKKMNLRCLFLPTPHCQR